MRIFGRQCLSRLGRDQSAATALEYGLIAALIVVAIIYSVGMVADENNKKWNEVTDAVATASS